MHVNHPLIKPGTLALRSYQETVFSRAVDGNTLVVLPTGLGKTVIAAMLAAHRLYNFPDSKVLFLAPTRPLAVQHSNTFGNMLNAGTTTTLTGMDAVEDRKKLWAESRIIFATPQTIENDVMRGLDLSDVSLIIFDECHRCVGDYSYVFIAAEYVKKAKNPLILGLTASPSGDKETVKEICKNLFIDRVEARTEKDGDVAPYIKETEVSWIKVDLPSEFKKIRSLIEDLLRQDLRLLKDRGFLESADLGKVNKRMLLEMQAGIRKEITSGGDAFAAASLAASALKVNHALELVETQGISALDSYLERLEKQKSKAIRRLFMDERMTELRKTVHDLRVLGVDHPKLDELVKLVKKHEKEKIMIFTQYRDSVDKIIERLNENDVLAHEFIGQARKGDKKGMSQKEQMRVLDDFRSGKYNVLVATSVAEEGLDIPAVDLVVFYEPIPSEIRSIQRRGRTGRSASGNVVVLMARQTRDEAYYWASVHKEKKMRGVVKQMQGSFGDGLAKDKEDADKGQASLIDYGSLEDDGEGAGNAGENQEQPIKVFVDSRERCIDVLKTLRENVQVEVRTLEVGDYILSERVGVERKTVEDFLVSLIDKRLFTQAGDLSRTFKVPVLIIEGQGDLYSLRGINPNAVRGAIASLAIDYGICVIRSRNEEDTAGFLYLMAKREQEEGREASVRGERKPLLLGEQQRFVVESLPNVSAVLAKRLLEKFGSVDAVVNASKKQLMDIEGIGEGKAEEIVKVVRNRYEKK